MIRLLFCLALVLLLTHCGEPEKLPDKAQAKPVTTAPASPNIVMLVGDDQGYPYFGFMGADYVKTLNMDALRGRHDGPRPGRLLDSHAGVVFNWDASLNETGLYDMTTDPNNDHNLVTENRKSWPN